mmetsp:Transcript_15909/g.31093  ORF Transcript_15909/g.31093 Transcript_15909/m.31093 type:complete len:395 (-) Transcript_15909:192-1376(-)
MLALRLLKLRRQWAVAVGLTISGCLAMMFADLTFKARLDAIKKTTDELKQLQMATTIMQEQVESQTKLATLDSKPPYMSNSDFELTNPDTWTAAESGFPGKPLTLEDARFCDKSMQVSLKMGYECDEDPTCVTCALKEHRHYWMARNQTASWYSEKEVKLRQKAYSNFKPGLPMIVQAVNKGQSHLWLNWACSCDANGISVRGSTLMVPTDYAAYEVIINAGFQAIKPTWTKSFEVDPKWEGKQGHDGHRYINNAVLLTVDELLARNHTVLTQDVDFIWMRDPRPWLEITIQGKDLLTTLAPRWDALGPVNTGFLYVQSNRKTRIFIKSLINMLPIKNWSDQLLVNTMLRHYKMRQVSFAILPDRLFPRMTREWAKRRTNVHTHHSHSSFRIHL